MSLPKMGEGGVRPLPWYPKSVGPEFSSSLRLSPAASNLSDVEKIRQIGSAGTSRGGYVKFESEKKIIHTQAKMYSVDMV